MPEYRATDLWDDMYGIYCVRLLSFEMQESYFDDIVKRYHSLEPPRSTTMTTRGTDIASELAALSVSDGAATATGDIVSADAAEQNKLLMAMRKIREGIVASGRHDPFAVKTYMFCIRAAILARHVESYHPAMLHLLRCLRPRVHLTPSELDELVGYLILDLVCRQQQPAEAISVRCRYGHRGGRVDAVLDAIIHGNPHLFWRTKSHATEYESRLMEHAEDRMHTTTVRCLERAYFTVDARFLRSLTNLDWDRFQARYRLPWTLDGPMIVIRRRPGC